MTADGYSFLYQGVVLSGSILYGGAGVYLAYRAVVRFASERAALVAAVLVTLGGNLVYYLTAEPSMSHAPSAFLSGLFFYAWIQGRERGAMGLRRAVLLGGGRVLTLPVLIQRSIVLNLEYAMGSALAAVLLVSVLLINILSIVLMRRLRVTRLAT